MAVSKKKEQKEEVTQKDKQYIALVTKRVGSNPDGSARYNLIKDKPISLDAKTAKNLKNKNLIK